MKLFAVCTPGIETFTSQELKALGLPPLAVREGGPDTENGGVEFEGSLVDVYRSNLHLRTASRILVRIGLFYASGFSELQRKAAHLPWEEFLAAEGPTSIRVTCHKSRLYHQRAVAERIAGAISDRLGHSNPSLSPVPKRENPSGNPQSFGDSPHGSQLIFARLVSNHCTISIDSSGELLHRRGYRLATTKAPLRETLAAGMLMASGWDGISPILDPFCGSGTIPIEAALIARRIVPGLRRRFAFMKWPNFRAKAWEALLLDRPQDPPSPFPQIIASDRDAGAIRAAQANAARAGVADCIAFSCRAVSSIEPPPGPGWVVTNPPYGERTKTNLDLRNLYAQFGKVLRAKCPDWRITALCTSAQLLRCTGLGWDQGIPLLNGGIRVKLFRGRSL